MYKEIYPKVERYILSNSGTREDSKDIFQEAILAFYKYVIEDRCDRIYDVQGFIIGIGKNLWINRARKLSKEVDVTALSELEERSPGPLIGLILSEKWRAYQALFENIGEKCRQLLSFSVNENLSMREIAEKMGLPNENAAKAQNYRCKQKLMELIGENKELTDLLKS